MTERSERSDTKAHEPSGGRSVSELIERLRAVSNLNPHGQAYEIVLRRDAADVLEKQFRALEEQRAQTWKDLEQIQQLQEELAEVRGMAAYTEKVEKERDAWKAKYEAAREAFVERLISSLDFDPDRAEFVAEEEIAAKMKEKAANTPEIRTDPTMKPGEWRLDQK